MPRKPPTCAGCSFYATSSEWVPDELREGAEVFIVGQNPGVDEAAQGRPFVGKTGAIMEARYLKDAGLGREDVSIGNAIRCRWKNTNDLPPVASKDLKAALSHCTQAHFRIPTGTKLIVAQGDYASVLLTGRTVSDGDSSTGWRGYVVPYLGQPPTVYEQPWVPLPGDLPVLVTVHLARLFREPWLTLPTRRDWSKVPRILRHLWPQRPPRFVERPPDEWPAYFTFDTEFYRKDGHEDNDPDTQLIRYSMSWGPGDGETAVVEWTPEHRAPVPPRDIRPRAVTQYAPADVWHLSRISHTGRDVWDRFLIEDTVWKHATLWSDHSHDLNFLGSIYSRFNRWKHLSDTDPVLYSGLDAVGLWDVDQALERELNADPLSRKVWETIDRPALGEFVRAQYKGLATNPARVDEAVRLLKGRAEDAQARGRAICGWPINIGSPPQVSKRLYEVEGIKVPRGA